MKWELPRVRVFLAAHDQRELERREVEAKVEIDSPDELRGTFAEMGATPVFLGRIEATYFDCSPWPGVRARVRSVTVEDSAGMHTKYFWTIKHDPRDERGVKDRAEHEGEAGSLEEARETLRRELQALLGIASPPDLVEELSISKTRESFTCPAGVCSGVQLDLDTLTRVNGRPIDPPITILEIEGQSASTVLACAEGLGFSEGQLEGTSTKRVLRAHGYL